LHANNFTAEACDHVRLLAEVCPDWCKLIDLIAGTVVRVEPDVIKLPNLKARVAKLMEEPYTATSTSNSETTVTPTTTTSETTTTSSGAAATAN
jgi:hypothetical protein